MLPTRTAHEGNLVMTGHDRSSRASIALVVALLVPACGPETGDEDPPGTLVFEHPTAQIFRLDRRVEVIALDPQLSRSGCGFLTDRAYDDLEDTIAALDPSVDYGFSHGCEDTPNFEGRAYLDGFEHSPFACEWRCCHPELIRVALVYSMVENNLSSLEPVFEGEPYVALEPDRPCP